MVNRDENDDEAAAVDRSGEAAPVAVEPGTARLLLLVRNSDSHRLGGGLGCRGCFCLEKVGPTGMVNPRRRGGWFTADVGDRRVLIKRVSEAAKGRICSVCCCCCCFIRAFVINEGAMGTVG